MNPDYDDYDDVPTEQEEEGSSRTLPRLVVGLAVVGFLALAIYAYRSGDDSSRSGELATIEADLSAIKERPTDPDGEQFPNKDKTIYDAISPYNGADGAGKVEKLLPEPEEPVKPATGAATTSDAKTWVNEAIRQQEVASPDPEEAVKAAVAQSSQPVDVPVAEVAKPVQAQAPVETARPVAAAQPVAAPKPTPVAKLAEAKPVTATSASGSYKVQLGAFKTEAEANSTWSKIISRNGDVLSGKAKSIVRADLPNGTYYRLRVGGFATPEAAKSACATLSARKQGCFFAGK